MLLHDKYQMRDVALAPGLQALVPGEVDLLEVDRRLVRGRPQVLDRDVLDRDVDLVALSGEEGLDRLALAVRLDGRVGEPPVQVIERRRIVLPDRRLAPAPSARSGGLCLSVASINRYGPMPAYISCRYDLNVTIS